MVIIKFGVGIKSGLGFIVEMITKIKCSLYFQKEDIIHLSHCAGTLQLNKVAKRKGKVYRLTVIRTFFFYSRKMLKNYIEGNCYLLLLIL